MSQRERLSKIMTRPTTEAETPTDTRAKTSDTKPPAFERDVQLNVKVPESVRQRARLAALRENTTIEKIVTRLLSDWLETVDR